MKDTAIAIRQGGRRIWRGKCPSDPKTLARTIRKHAPEPQRIVFETGPLATWFFHDLTAEGLPAICIEARHAQKILSETLNKTDANDADGLAQLAETGFYKAVRVKSFDAMLIRTLVGARTQLLTITTQLTNQIRGVLKTFGLIVPKGIGCVFDFNVRELLEGQTQLAQIILGKGHTGWFGPIPATIIAGECPEVPLLGFATPWIEYRCRCLIHKKLRRPFEVRQQSVMHGP